MNVRAPNDEGSGLVGLNIDLGTHSISLLKNGPKNTG